MQSRALKKTSRLIVIVTPKAHDQEAEFLRGEVADFKRQHPDGLIVPIGSTDTLSSSHHPQSKLLPLLPHPPDYICIVENQEELLTGNPSSHAVAKLLNDLAEERNSTMRFRWIRRVAIALALLLMVAMGLGIFAFVQMNVASTSLVQQRQHLDALRVRDALILEDNDQLSYARDSLDKVADQNRSAAWRIARNACDGGDIILHSRFTSITNIVFSPTKGYFATVNGPFVDLYDANTFALLRTLEVLPARRIIGVAFRPKANEIASCNEDMTLSRWDVATGKFLGTQKLSGTPASIQSCAFSPDGSKLITGLVDSRLASALDKGDLDKEAPIEPVFASLWDVETGHLVSELNGHRSMVLGCAFSPDGSLAATACWDKCVRIWKTATGRNSLTVEGSESVNDVVFSPDGRFVVGGGDGRDIQIWDTATGMTLKKMSVEKPTHALIRTIAISPDGRSIASGGLGGSVRIWDTATGALWRQLEGSGGNVNELSFSPDGQILAVGNADDVVNIYSLSNSATFHETRVSRSHVRSIAFSPDGRLVAAPGDNKDVHLVDVSSSAKTKRLVGRQEDIRHVAFCRDGSMLAGCSDKEVLVWNTSTGEILHRLEGGGEGDLPLSANFSWDNSKLCAFFGKKPVRDHTRTTMNHEKILRFWTIATKDDLAAEFRLGPASTVSYSETRNMIAVCYGPGQQPVEINRLESGEKLSLGSNSWSTSAMAFGCSDNVIATAGHDRVIRIWSTQTGEQIRTLYGADEDIGQLCWSPDGRTLASSITNGGVCLWDGFTEQYLGLLREQKSTATCLAFSDDGCHFATGGIDGIIRCWDTSHRKRSIRYGPHIGKIFAMCPSPSGTVLASGGQDGTVKLWSVNDGRLLATFQVGQRIVMRVQWSADGKVLVATLTQPLEPGKRGGVAEEKMLWDVEARKQMDGSDLPQDLYSGRNEDAYFESGGYFYKIQWTLSEEEAARRLSLTKVNPEWHKQLADIAEAEGDYFAARFHMRILADLHPDDVVLRARLEEADRRIVRDEAQDPKALGR